MNKTIITTLSVLVLIICKLSAQDDKIVQLSESNKLHETLYKGTIDKRYLTSQETNCTYELSIYLPIKYSATLKKYPGMILMDAENFLGIAQITMDMLSRSKEIPELIVIGIDFPATNRIQKARFRYQNMTSTYVDGFNPSGNADSFIAFYEKELLPFIKNNFRIDTTDMCYYGHSLSGLLGTHILLEKSFLFNRYILGSPSYWWDNTEIIKRLSIKHDLLKKQNFIIYTFVGNRESKAMIENWNTFFSTFQSKIGPNVKLFKQLYQDQSHSSVGLAAFSTAVGTTYSKISQ